MAEIIFKCSNCETSIVSDNNLCGEIIICKYCETETVVPIPGIEPGIELGDFKLIELIGSGASGEVWLAYQKSMDRRVALKVLNPKMASDQTFINRFRKEAKNAAKMAHPNIVTAYYYGEEKGLCYLAITYVDGETIETVLENGDVFEEKEALEIVKNIAIALKYAWDEFKIVHRDIKPANIIINKKGIPMLLDLGISKNTQEDMALTLTGTVVGTPYYMSPEQAVGDKSIDFRSDIYALGTTLYHMLTGRVPFHATTSMAIIMKHLNEDYVALDALNPKISKQCSVLIDIMLAKNKPERHQSCNALIKDIDLVLNGKFPISPRPSEKSFSKTKAAVKVKKKPTTIKKKNHFPVKIYLLGIGIILLAVLITVLLLPNNIEEKNLIKVQPGQSATKKKVSIQSHSEKIDSTNISSAIINNTNSFQTIVKLLDLTKQSKADVAKNWKKINGKQLQASGKFVLYRSRTLRDDEVRVAVPFCKLYQDFNLILVTPEEKKAKKFKLGQTLKFQGILYKYNSKHDGTVVLYMKNVLFSNKVVNR
jgi:serine/threonine-protein kinase